MTEERSTPETNDSGEKYYRGIIHTLQSWTQRGTIRSASGREVPFVFAFVTMLGARRRFEDLREGIEVGYDVSWTSRGLRVSVIRIID